MTVISEKATFPGALGAFLAARFDRPAGEIRATALFAHCFTCSKDMLAATRIAAGLALRGIAVLRFDFTGLGASDGEFANTDFSSNIADLVAAANYLRETSAAPALLVGHSLGGAAVLAAAEKIPEARAVVAIGAPSDPSHVAHLFEVDRSRIEADGVAAVTIAGRSFHVRKEFLQDIEGHALADKIGRMKKALLVAHSPQDQVVGIDNASAIFLAARHPKSFVSLDGADHLLSRREDAAYLSGVISAWADRYMPAPKEMPEPESEDVVVAENGIGKLSQDVVIGRHLLHADEPRSVGGDETGPTPYQLLAAALGTCTVMTMRLYADRKGWPLKHASVRIGHDKIHAIDCAECETREGRVDRFVRTITLDGALDNQERARILEIADKCPVHRTLHSKVSVETRLATPEKSWAK